MLLEIQGKRYPLIDAGSATLADLLAIKRQTGIGVKELQDLAERFDGMTEAELEAAAEDDPDSALMLMGISIWLSRRAAGEKDLTLEEACDVNLDDVRQIAEPGDKKPAKKAAAKKKAAADPQ